MLPDFDRVVSRALKLLGCAERIPSVVADCLHLHAVLFLDAENEVLDNLVVDNPVPAGDALASPDELVVVDFLIGVLLRNAPLWHERENIGEDVAVIVCRHHCNRRVVVRLGKV